MMHSDAANNVHYPQDPRSPGLPAFGPSWSLGWLLLPPWWASCAAWRTQRWANMAKTLQHDMTTIWTPFEKKKKSHQPTLSMILPFSCVGEGSCSAICSTGSVRSLSPNTSLKMRAIWRCWSREQCSSMDRITGYLRGKHRRQKVDTTGILKWTYLPEKPNTVLSLAPSLLRCDESVLVDGLDHVFKLDPGRPGPAMVDDRLPRSFPAVH